MPQLTERDKKAIELAKEQAAELLGCDKSKLNVHVNTGCSQVEELPYDQGAEAYRSKQLMESNPFDKSAWQYEEWGKGWMAENDIDSDDSFDWSSSAFKSE